uniref:Uncharacterized protein n=1 Tax=Lepeophtheirus salmonis TaxID=72036 RepID=A0A0K2UTG5_LEPSM
MKRETIEIGKGDGEKIPKPEEIEKSTAKFNGKIQKCHANEEDEVQPNKDYIKRKGYTF